MEDEIRGKMEKLIDDWTDEKFLADAFALIGEFKPLIKSEQDAVFGFLFALAMGNFAAYYKMTYNRSPSTSETIDFRKMILERSIIIMSKIQTFSNR